MEGEAVEPALGVADGGEGGGPGEGLVVRGIGVGGEAGSNELSFFGGEERCCVGVVVDEEVGADADYDGGDALLERGLGVNLMGFK